MPSAKKATAPTKPRLRVAGTCSCGRKQNQIAPAGRATVETTCPRDGCGKKVKLTAVSDAAITQPAPVADPAPAPTPRKVPRVDDYKRPPRPAKPAPVVPPAAPAPGPTDGPGPTPDPVVEPVQPEPEREPGRLRAAMARRRDRRAQRPPREHPYGGLFPGI